MRMGIEFQRMGQHHQIETVGRKRQIMQVGQRVSRTGIAPVVAAEAQRHAVGAQEIVAREGELHGIEAKYIGDQQVMFLLLPVKHILACRCFQPLFETLN